jgi:hypothetical protein
MSQSELDYEDLGIKEIVGDGQKEEKIDQRTPFVSDGW